MTFFAQSFFAGAGVAHSDRETKDEAGGEIDRTKTTVQSFHRGVNNNNNNYYNNIIIIAIFFIKFHTLFLCCMRMA